MKKNKSFIQKVLTIFKKRDIIKYTKKQNIEKVEKEMKLNALLEQVKETKYTVANDKMKQTERNELKRQLVDAVAEKLSEDIQIVGMSKKGVIVAVENDVEGAIYATVDVVVKGLDYDPAEDLEDYEIAEAKRIEREAKRQKATG